MTMLVRVETGIRVTILGSSRGLVTTNMTMNMEQNWAADFVVKVRVACDDDVDTGQLLVTLSVNRALVSVCTLTDVPGCLPLVNVCEAITILANEIIVTSRVGSTSVMMILMLKFRNLIVGSLRSILFICLTLAKNSLMRAVMVSLSSGLGT